ncbi:MAG: LPS assembly lipoprotein LptE [Alphaproteobacteria bacterium]
MSWSRNIANRRRALALCLSAGVLLGLLGGCGYRPLYASGGDSGVADELAAVKIGLIPNRTGQQLRNILLDRMNPRGEPSQPLYRLVVAVLPSRQELGVRKDDTSTRANFILQGKYRLLDAKNGRILFEADSRRVASYNISDDDFSTISAAEAARGRVASEMADEIVTRIAVYLNRRRAAKAKASRRR